MRMERTIGHEKVGLFRRIVVGILVRARSSL
jgi:hypothetical protein